jgi:hypothetical protein
MRVQFVCNLGSRDAEGLEIDDWRKCTTGETVDVPAKSAKWLCDNGIAVPAAGQGDAATETGPHAHAHAHAHTHAHETETEAHERSKRK